MPGNSNLNPALTSFSEETFGDCVSNSAALLKSTFKAIAGMERIAGRFNSFDRASVNSLFEIFKLIFLPGISYYGRTYAEGKKIGWKDGVAAVWAILRYNLFG